MTISGGTMILNRPQKLQKTYTFNLLSPAFRDGAAIPIQYTCKGQNINPPLTIMHPPRGTRSFALVVHDPDAVNGDFTHWLVWDISPGTELISVNDVPVGAVQGLNDVGENKYMGPCPPGGTGTHHYLFELHALNKTLGLPPTTKRHSLEQAIEQNLIETTVLCGLFAAEA